MNKGFKHSLETRAKISVARRGRRASLEACANMSVAHRGHEVSPATRVRMSVAQLGELGNNWKGGRPRHSEGYVLVLCPGHPFAQRDGYVFEHRLVMEAILGRQLLPAEIVHHLPINGDKADNRKENLALCNNRAAHRAIHSGEIYLPI